jgi:8-oxo-dGTP pyrophosphatase MutT (NUDIX family)
LKLHKSDWNKRLVLHVDFILWKAYQTSLPQEIHVEICDIVDKFGNRTGRVATRGIELAPDEYYPVVHVWIRDERGNYLIQQRAFHLASGPGIWAATVGYILAGEESSAAAIREVDEELGIQIFPTHLKRIDRHAMENRVEDVWLADVLSTSIGTPIAGPEVAAWKWVSKVKLQKLVSQNDFFRYSYFDRMLARTE